MPLLPPDVPSLGLFGPGGPTISKSYQLPENKLKALTTLMSRSDVPVLIRPGDDEITVQGDADIQARFEIFASMIDPGEETVEEYKVPDGKREMLTELMALSDVPVLIEQRKDGIAVHGNEFVQSAFRSFVNLIAPEATGKLRRTSSTIWSTSMDRDEARAERKAERKERSKARRKAKRKTTSKSHAESHSSLHGHSGIGAHGALAIDAAKEQLAHAYGMAKGQHAKALQAALSTLESSPDVQKLVDAATKMAIEAKIGGSDQQRAAIDDYVQNIMNKVEPFVAQAEALREQARGLEAQADKLENLADELEEKADGIRSEAGDKTDEERSEFFEQAEQMNKEKLAIMDRASAMFAQVESFESLADQFEQRADFFEQAAQAVQNALEQVEHRADATDTD